MSGIMALNGNTVRMVTQLQASTAWRREIIGNNANKNLFAKDGIVKRQR